MRYEELPRGELPDRLPDQPPPPLTDGQQHHRSHPSDVLLLDEAAELLGLTTTRLRELVEAGQVPHGTLGGRLRFVRAAMDDVDRRWRDPAHARISPAGSPDESLPELRNEAKDGDTRGRG